MKQLFFFLFALILCIDNLTAQTFTDDYSSSAGWTHQSNGNTIGIQNGSLNFNQTYCGGTDEYMYKPLGFTLDNAKWSMDFEWKGTAGSNTGVSALIATLTSQTSDPAYTTPDTSTSVTNNNMISVLYFSCYGCGSAGNGIEILTKRGTSQYVWHNALHIPLPFFETGYIRLERLSANTGMVSVFTDNARTQHRVGSPRCFPIQAGITDLRYLQHGAWVPGSIARYTSGKVDNVTVANNVNHSSNTNATVTGTPAICANTPATLNAYQAGYTSYTWSNGSNASSIAAQQAGTYTVTVTSASGCIGTGSVTVATGILPRPNIIGDNILCGSTTTVLTANDGTATPANSSTFYWSNGITGASINATAGAYTVTATNSVGCTATLSRSVLQGTPPPAPYFSVQGNTIGVANPQVGATYQWYLNNTPIPNAINETYTISSSGVYSICTIMANNCQTCSGPIYLAYLSTSPTHTIPLIISPNPTNGVSRISGLPTQKHQLRVFDALGQSVLSVENTNTEYNLDLSNFASGVYFLQIQNETWKIIKNE